MDVHWGGERGREGIYKGEEQKAWVEWKDRPATRMEEWDGGGGGEDERVQKTRP